ncbi:MAG TPA: DUF4097 family beta strand repeat-containing protein [Ktedonobacteraceae bacterium]|jgi:DUF4097 and DUF4098 domain-containing protein YvlB|nr:DUF4097 family beta strand repeat-containing protein [Ktedonobacteraceae bacterium]
MQNSMYEETYGSGNIPQYKKPERRRAGRIVMFVVIAWILSLLLVGGLVFVVRLLNPTPVRTITETRIFNLAAGMQPTLIVTNDQGFVHVHAGTGNTITVTTTKVGDSYGASPDDFKVSYIQHGNTIIIQVNNDSIHLFDFSNSSQADLDVTVPARSDLQLETDSGDITANGINGKMTLTSNSGSLQATEDSLDSGSRLTTDSGNITMRGSIGATGNYLFQSNSGTIDVTLPASTSFHARLASNSGSITNEFPLANAHQPGSNDRTVIGDVGVSPQATLTMQSDSGSLNLSHL